MYISEAHPTDGWQIDSNVQESILYAQPTSRQERADVAKACVLGLDLAMPTLLDDMIDSTNLAYAAIPEKLYLIDAEGIVRFRTGPGPWFFDPEAWNDAIDTMLTYQRLYPKIKGLRDPPLTNFR